jgi:site-specific recombinase XerD
MASKLKLQPNGYLYLVFWQSTKLPVRIPTKIKVSPKDWDKKEGKLINTKLKDINGKPLADQLKKMEGAFQYAIEEYKAGRTFDVKKCYYDRMDITVRAGGVNAPAKFLEYFDKRVKEMAIKPEKGYTGYRLAYNNLLEYLGRKRPFFEDLTVQFFEDFTEFLETKKKYRIGSIRQQVKLLRTIINEAYIKKLHSNLDHKSFSLSKKYKSEEINNIYLTLDEIDLIHNLNLKDRPELISTRDSFIVGLWTGLRFSDWGKVRSNLIIDGKIRIQATKNNNTALIPVHPYVYEVLKKYGGVMPEQLWNAEANLNIKEICRLAGITQPVIKSYTKGGVMEGLKPVPKYSLCSTHTARRSLCTNMIKQKAPVFVVMAISGHKSLEAFQKYIKLDEIDIADTLDSLPMFRQPKKQPVKKPKPEVDLSKPAYSRL